MACGLRRQPLPSGIVTPAVPNAARSRCSHLPTQSHMLAARQASQSADLTQALQQSVRDAQARGTALRIVGGDSKAFLADGPALWARIREQRDGFFAGDTPLWRLSVPPATPPPDLSGKWLLDGGGSLRWLRTDTDAPVVRAAAESAGGTANLFRGGERTAEVYHPLTPRLMELHRRLKRAFDPRCILNPGRLYADA
jgi:hypothetical protein